MPKKRPDRIARLVRVIAIQNQIIDNLRPHAGPSPHSFRALALLGLLAEARAALVILDATAVYTAYKPLTAEVTCRTAEAAQLERLLLNSVTEFSQEQLEAMHLGGLFRP